jgi:hypothetical protein
MTPVQTTAIDSRRSSISTDVDAHIGEPRAAAHDDFARGQRRTRYLYGDFATGMRRAGMPRATGDFATGMRVTGAQTTVGDFATGMRTVATPVAVEHPTSAQRALPIAA